MRDLHDCLPFTEHLRMEHRRLNELLRRVRGWLADLGIRNLSNSQPSIAETLAVLRTDLAHHFREEEAGGCMEEAVCRCPSLSPEATRVESQHAILLDGLDRVIAQAGNTRPELATATSLIQRFDEFAANLRQHESAENRILQLGFGTDTDLGE